MATETENVKRRHDGASQGSGGHLTRKGPCKMVPVQEEIYRGWIALRHRLLQPFVMNRFDICRQHAVTLEKDTHAQNRERVP